VADLPLVDPTGDPYRHWGDRTPLADDDGLVLVLSLAESTRTDRPWADGLWRPSTVVLGRAVEMARTALAGYTVSTGDEELAGALLADGADPVRHAHTMTHDLTAVPAAAVEPSVLIGPLDAAGLRRRAAALGAVALAAYPAGHPDHEHDRPEDAIAELDAIAGGRMLGPFLEVSTLARVGDRTVGACLVVDRPGSAPDGGPWVIDVFRDPSVPVRGIGAALLGASLHRAADAGLASLSLVVSHGNASAMRLYRRLGFVGTGRSWTVRLP